MPKKIEELYWVLVVACVSVLIPLFRNWIISMVDKTIENKLAPINKQIEQIKNNNIELKDTFITTITNIEKEIMAIRHIIENQFTEMMLILEQNYVKKIDCDECNKYNQ